MNDELNNQLCSQWAIPAYALPYLWVTTPFDAVQPSGNQGDFTLRQPAPYVDVRWGSAIGPALVRLGWRSDNLLWTGEVVVGGSAEALHLISGDAEETAVALLVFSGHILKPGSRSFPRMSQPAPGSRFDFFEMIDREDAPQITTWMVSYLSPWFMMLHDAMSNAHNLVLRGRLDDGPDAGRLATPLVLHELTLFAR
jgi:hypothetical protein